jgi:hypothetical protein
MHTLLEQIRAQIGNVKEYVNKGHHHRAIVTELEKVEKRFSEYEEVASLASLAPAAESEGDRVCHDDDGCPTENAVLRREWRKLTAQVAALTAQCDAAKRANAHLLKAIRPLIDAGIAVEELRAAVETVIAVGNGEGV